MKECPSCGTCYEDGPLNCANDGSSLTTTFEGPPLIDGKYLLERCLGRGAMGSVYKAVHKDLQKTFALKLIQHSGLSDPDSLARFRIEAKALGKLQHPNIVQVTDYGVDPREKGIPYLVMEYLEGETLSGHLRRKGHIPIDEALTLLESIADAIDYAHSSNVLHRDLKLQNIFLADDISGQARVKVLDFGLARIVEEPPLEEQIIRPEQIILPEQNGASPPSMEFQEAQGTQTLPVQRKKEGEPEEKAIDSDRLTRAGSVMGTPGYMAPEILQGLEATPASDIYSFGVVVYELLVGHPPDHDIGKRITGKKIHETAPLPSAERREIPEDMDQAILRPIHQRPDKRSRTAKDVVLRLREAHARYTYRTWRNEQWPKRIQLAGVLTLIFALCFWISQSVPIFKSIENFFVDARFHPQSFRPPDDRILLVSIDEATLQEDPALLTEKADEMGTLLQGVMDQGASGVAVDFLLPKRWSQSEHFSKFVLNNQERLVLASYITKDGSILGWELTEGLIMAALGSAEKAESLFGFVNLDADSDGRIRTAQLGVRKQDESWMYSLAAKSFRFLSGRKLPDDRLLKALWIDYSIDWDGFKRISWKDLPSVLEQTPALFQDKVVIVGGEYEGSQDYHRVPVRREKSGSEVSGMVLGALILNSLLLEKTIREYKGYPLSIFMVFVLQCFFTASFIYIRYVPTVAVLLLIAAGYSIGAYILFTLNRQLLPVGIPLILLAGAVIAAALARRRLTFYAKPATKGA
jgi:serine/threonine protein kinase